mgnify:CR=1 FL=1
MDTKHVLNTHITNIVRLYGKELRDKGVQFTQLIVFGSQAKGTAKQWSDIDVCVVSPAFGNDRHTERVGLMRVRDDRLLDIEPHPFSPADLDDKYDPLASEIRKYGIRVV